jgi:hypothetical protein
MSKIWDMKEINALNLNLEELNKLFPNQINEETKVILKKIFHNTEKSWISNVSRFPNKIIKYLLICETPPLNGTYFYSGANTRLFTTVWKTFFIDPICVNPNNAYQCLADKGFLLIDTLPYAMNYKTANRKNPVYDELIQKYLHWWINKLNSNFIFAPDLKIAFGFKLNGLSVIKGNGGSICLHGRHYKLNSCQIVAYKNHRWQPSTLKLGTIFQNLSKQKCTRC